MKFSQRIGKTPLTKEIQLESIDPELKNGLWNIYTLNILKPIADVVRAEKTNLYGYYDTSGNDFCVALWHYHFKKNVDTIPPKFWEVESSIKTHFFSYKWYEIYDFLEFNMELVRQNMLEIPEEDLLERFHYILGKFNEVLETEFAGYRFIDGILSPITNATEMQEIETSLSTTENFTPLKNCNIHLKDALDKLSNKNNPDYRNSIKEAISAVECIAKIISGGAKDSLGEALKKINTKIKIHPSLVAGFGKIYGYTSDEGGIRHSLTDETEPCDFEDAKFMLVSCSAFINYLVVKADKVGIDIKN